MHELRVDRAEAGVRTVVGSLLGDEELRAQGERGLSWRGTRGPSAPARARDLDGWTT